MTAFGVSGKVGQFDFATDYYLQQTITCYTVVVSAPNPDERLFPGMTANITITTQSPHGIIVPAEALYFVPDADQLKEYRIEEENTSGNRLWIKTEFGLKAVPVTAGASDGVETIILSGINIGDSIVVGTEKTILKAKAEGASLFPILRNYERILKYFPRLGKLVINPDWINWNLPLQFKCTQHTPFR